MPYITPERQRAIGYLNQVPENAGELNFFICIALLGYLNFHGFSYQRLNDCIGALEGAKMELYRREVAPYEDEKMAENGDIFA